MARNARTTLFLLVLACGIAHASSHSEPAAPATLRAVPCPVADVPDEVTCYEATVFEGDLPIQFPVAVLPPIGRGAAWEPVAFVPGGPGASAFDDLAELARYRRLRERRMLVAIDARGSGLARPALTCATDLDALATCRSALDQDGPGLEAFSSERIAADVEAVRRGLGIDRWVVWGSSYGSKVALLYGKAYPAATTRLVLDLPYPPQADLFVEEMGHRLDAIATVAAQCARDRGCRRAFGDVRAQYARAIEGAEAAPLPVVFGGEPTELDGTALFAWLAQLQFDSRTVGWVPAAVVAAAQRDVASLEAIDDKFQSLAAASALDPERGLAVGMNLSIECPEKLATAREPGPEWARRGDWPPGVLAIAQRARDDYRAVCEAWAGELRRAPSDPAAKADAEALVLVMRLDPGSTDRWGRQMLDHLAKGRMLRVASSSHSPRSEAAFACVDRVLARFARHGLDDLAADCADDIEPLRFSRP